MQHTVRQHLLGNFHATKQLAAGFWLKTTPTTGLPIVQAILRNSNLRWEC